MSKIYLKVKIKSLAEEARIIRREERKALNSARYCNGKQGKQTESEEQYKLFFELKAHRQGIVREESRAALIAYAFIRGKSFASLSEQLPEKTAFDKNGWCYYSNRTLWSRVGRLIYKYSHPHHYSSYRISYNEPGSKKSFLTMCPEMVEKWTEGEKIDFNK